jgi:dTDP-4-dehydrorhamnose 3,5-epimerase
MIIKEFFGLKDIYEIELEPVKDYRGEFKRTYDDNIFNKYHLNTKWVQENHSTSFKKNTVRGLHFQFPPYTETKLVRSVRGEILDVFVDMRKDSETFGKWGSIILSETNNKAIYIPRGFAHGFRTLTDNCQILYNVDNYYSPQNESGIRWDDPYLNIDWKFDSEDDKNGIMISKKDANLPYFKFEMKI